MSNSSSLSIANTVLSLFSAVLDISALLVCLILLLVIIYRVVRIRSNRRLLTTDVPLLLSITIICVISIKSTLQIVHVTFPTLTKDFQLRHEFKETPFLRYRAYTLCSMIGVLFWSHSLLAFSSFARVIYPTKIWLQRSSLYLRFLIPGLFIFVFSMISPLLYIFDSFHQIPNEAYCGIPVFPTYRILYASTIYFTLPVNVVCIFHILIARKLKQTVAIRENLVSHRRDFIVIRRMLFTTVILSIMSVPYLVLFIINLFKGHLESILPRVQWVSSSGGSCLFSIVLPLISTRLRGFLRPNRLAPENR